MTINQKKQSIVAVRLRLFPIRMPGKQRLLNNYYYLGRHPPSWNSQREKTGNFAKSDWMEIEKQRGISVTSSVMQFDYQDKRINILDTPGHEDFSEDTYRTLMAVDSAVMVIDSAKGIEAQTKNFSKLLKTWYSNFYFY